MIRSIFCFIGGRGAKLSPGGVSVTDPLGWVRSLLFNYSQNHCLATSQNTICHFPLILKAFQTFISFMYAFFLCIFCTTILKIYINFIIFLLFYVVSLDLFKASVLLCWVLHNLRSSLDHSVTCLCYKDHRDISPSGILQKIH